MERERTVPVTSFHFPFAIFHFTWQRPRLFLFRSRRRSRTPRPSRRSTLRARCRGRARFARRRSRALGAGTRSTSNRRDFAFHALFLHRFTDFHLAMTDLRQAVHALAVVPLLFFGELRKTLR